MKRFFLAALLLFTLTSFGQEVFKETKYTKFIVPSLADSTLIKHSKLVIGSQLWDIDGNKQMIWDGDRWLYDDAIIFDGGGYVSAYVDRSGVSYGGQPMGVIGTYAFDMTTNYYRTDNPGALGELAVAFGTDNKATGYASAVFGYNNTADAHYSLVTGVSNEIGGGGGSFVAGIALDADGAQGIAVVGEANIAPESIGIGPANDWRFIVGIGDPVNNAYYPWRGPGATLLNGFGVNENGNVYAFEATPSTIATHPKTLVTYEMISGDVPASASATGSKGQIAADASFIYICVATDTWVRAPLSTW